ncbi:hypothetical protein GCM10022222_21150 [Amycolatopsis ultiminotia]|uniref:Helix-turn-helix domain-containing protein n=2 Tax=Amycolatopsis ultiminotia TaxID=543629 RepID=A0ABP6VNV3_9PSEU
MGNAMSAGGAARMSLSPAVMRPEPTFYNVEEAAGVFRLDPSTMYRHLRSGRFPGLKIGGRYVVPRVVVERLLNDILAAGGCLDISEWTARWSEQAAGGVA